MPSIDRRPLLHFLRSQFAIHWHGHHGVPHWARVGNQECAAAQISRDSTTRGSAVVLAKGNFED